MKKKNPVYPDFELSDYAKSVNKWYHEERRNGTQFDFLDEYDRADKRASAGKFIKEFSFGLIVGLLFGPNKR